ncbi:MAG: gluconate 2-dehydrogenase subunit 3 family protein [Halovenus sp.]
MELTRRDALAALAAIGGTGGAAFGYRRLQDGDTGTPAELPDDEHVTATMVAVAEVVYPSELAGVEAFVTAFLDSRLGEGAHADGIREAVAELDDQGRTWHDGPVRELPPERREQLLCETGVDTADEDSEGTVAERVRYFVVNELLLALYSSPTGGKLVGLENPQGHPGGTGSYQQGPPGV